MKLTYFGHSAFQLETEGTRILVDPFITGNPHAEGVVEVDDLEPDIILLTHAHGDHFGDTPAIAKRSGAIVVANFEITTYLTSKHGHRKVQSMNTGGSWAFDWGTVTWTFARHSSSFPDGTYGGHPNGIIIQAEGKTVYDLGDTDPFAEMEWIGQDYDIDVALMPVGDCYTMGTRGSLRAARLIGPGLTIPIHYDTFPAIEIDVVEWQRLFARENFPARVLKAGETLEI